MDKAMQQINTVSKIMVWLLLIMLCSIVGCSFYMSVNSTKEKAPAPTTAAPAPQPTVAKEKPKTRYEQLKEEHNKEWLNLPHRESENELFQPK